MKNDSTIKAMRDARHRISEAVGHDPRKLVEHYRQLQNRHQDRLVSRPQEKLETEGEDAT